MEQGDHPPGRRIRFWQSETHSLGRSSPAKPFSLAAKPLQIHPAALAELKSARNWYHERNPTAAIDFVNELDRALDLVITSPGRWPSGGHGTRIFAVRAIHLRSSTVRRKSPSKFWLSPTGAGGQDTGRKGCVGPRGISERAENRRLTAHG